MKSIILSLFLITIAGDAISQQQNKPVDSVQSKIDLAVTRARAAIARYGATDSAMVAIQAVLSDIASLPGLKTRGQMKTLHGDKSMARALIASEGDTGICLYVSWFGKGATTPVHDHTTWGVVRVLDGRDDYTRWQLRPGQSSDQKSVRKTDELVLAPGESTYWLGPPNDIHSQHSADGDLWELVMVGRDLSSDYVNRNHHYYDAKTGHVLPSRSK